MGRFYEWAFRATPTSVRLARSGMVVLLLANAVYLAVVVTLVAVEKVG
jgi:hypothetical protein